MNPNCHIARVGALASAAALLLALVGCDRGGETTVRTRTAASGAEMTATGPGSTAASAVISGSGISSSTTTTTPSPGATIGTYPPAAVAPAASR
jgi:hypothetical protein